MTSTTKISVLALLFFANTALAQTPGGINVTTFKGWFKADNQTYSNTGGTTVQSADGGIVQQWKNICANSPTLTQVTANNSNSPILYTTNAARLMNFNSSLNFASPTALIPRDLRNTSQNILGPTATGFHFYCIARQNVNRWNGTNGKLAIFGNGGSGNNPGYDFEKSSSAPNGIHIWTDCNSAPASNNNNTTVYSGNGTGVGSTTTGTNQPTEWSAALQNQQPQIFGLANTGLVSGSCVNNSRLYTDGFRIAYPNTLTVRANTTYMLADGFYIGSSSSEGFPDADIAEMIVYNDELSDANRIKVETYLAIKYGITLGQGNNSSGNYKIGVNASSYIM